MQIKRNYIVSERGDFSGPARVERVSLPIEKERETDTVIKKSRGSIRETRFSPSPPKTLR